jgi:hypothetical protein
LTLAIVAINGWNRFAVGLRPAVGEYVSPHGREWVAPGKPSRGVAPSTMPAPHDVAITGG